MTANADTYVRDSIRNWVWSGFYSPIELRQRLDDIIEPHQDRAELEAFIDREVEAKRTNEQEWPGNTDCDRLWTAFDALHTQGICAIHNAGYTMSDGHEDVAQAVSHSPRNRYNGYCFYHGQDVERALDGQGLMLAFGALSGSESDSIGVGRLIVRELKGAGLDVVWNETGKVRLSLPNFRWQKRSYGRQRSWRMFFADYRRHRIVDSNDAQSVTRSEMLREMEAVLIAPDNFFGLIDAGDATLQFAVNKDLSIQVDIPVVAEKGSYAKTSTLEECMDLARRLGNNIRVGEIKGLSFKPW